MHVCNYTPLNCSSIDFRLIIQSTNFDGRDSLFTNICQGFSCYGNFSCFHVSRCNVTCAAVIDNINRPNDRTFYLVSIARGRVTSHSGCGGSILFGGWSLFMELYSPLIRCDEISLCQYYVSLNEINAINSIHHIHTRPINHRTMVNQWEKICLHVSHFTFIMFSPN